MVQGPSRQVIRVLSCATHEWVLTRPQVSSEALSFGGCYFPEVTTVRLLLHGVGLSSRLLSLGFMLWQGWGLEF